MSDELLAFLNARLDEDELDARNAERALKFPRAERGLGDSTAELQAALIREALAPHIARHDPARTFREVAAKRAILEWHYPGFPPAGAPEDLKICGGEEGDGDTWQMATPWPCPQIRVLAAVYSDHPDYRPEWKP